MVIKSDAIVTDEMVAAARKEFIDNIIDHANPHWGAQCPDYLMETMRRSGYPDPDAAANFFCRAAIEAALKVRS